MRTSISNNLIQKLSVMKKILLVVILLTVNGFLFAQKGKVSSAVSYKESGKLDKAWEAIQEAINPANPKSEKSINWPDTWEARGEILEAIYKSKDENYKKLVENPLEEAYKSFLKAMELDPKGGSPAWKLPLINGFFHTLGVAAGEAYELKKFEVSSNYFEMILNLQATPLLKADFPFDSLVVFNTGLASMQAKQFEKAIKYFSLSAQNGYNAESSYSYLVKAYQQKGDTLTAVKIMNEAYNKHPEFQEILYALINYNVSTNKPEIAIAFLDKAIAIDTTKNVSLYVVKGATLEKLGKEEDALKEYQKAIEINPGFANAYINIGVIYYNRGKKQIDIANDVPTNDVVKFEAEKKKADDEFIKAIPYLEKAVELDPQDAYYKENLKTLYYRLKMMDKFEKLNK